MTALIPGRGDGGSRGLVESPAAPYLDRAGQVPCPRSPGPAWPATTAAARPARAVATAAPPAACALPWPGAAPPPGAVALRPAPRGQASISRNARPNTPTWNHRVRTSDAAKSSRTAAVPVRASTGCTAAGSTSPAGGWQDAGVTVGSADTSRSCRQVRNWASSRPTVAAGTPAATTPDRSAGATVLAAGPDWAPSIPKKITPITAMPIELPTWRPVLNTPEAEPAFWCGTRASTMSASGAITAPRPSPAPARPGTRSQVVTAAP